MPDLRALALVVLAAATFACKGSEPAAKTDAKKADAGKKADEDKAAAEPAKEEEGAKPAEEVDSVDSADPPVDEAGAETEAEDEDPADAAPLPDTFDELGVEVCDQYVADYVACIDEKVPEDQRDAQRRIVFKNIEAWKQMQASGGPSAQQGLQIGCRSAREQAKRDTQVWACTW